MSQLRSDLGHPSAPLVAALYCAQDASLDMRGIPLEEVPDLPRYRRTDETVIAYSTSELPPAR